MKYNLLLMFYFLNLVLFRNKMSCDKEYLKNWLDCLVLNSKNI